MSYKLENRIVARHVGLNNPNRPSSPNSSSNPTLLVLLLATLLGVLAGCNKTETTPASSDTAKAAKAAKVASGPASPVSPVSPVMPALEVAVLTVHPKDLAQGFEYAGQTAGLRETEVRARVGGILEKTLYEEGSKVKAGALLFQIDAGSYRTQLAAAEAAAGVSLARLNQAQREFARLAPLASEKAISQKELEDAGSVLEIAQANHRQTAAQVNEAKLNLAYTTVRAPIDGITGVASKANGSLLTINDSLLTTLAQIDPILVNFSITEADYLKLAADLASGKVTMPSKPTNNGSPDFSVRLKLADGSLFPTSGKMNFMSAKINTATGGFDARAQIPNPDGILRPGQFVRVILSGTKRPNAITVPQRAVGDGQQGKQVLTVSPENKLVATPVEVDVWSQGEWLITKGLQDGDRVVVDGFKARMPGMTVKPVALPATAP